MTAVAYALQLLLALPGLMQAGVEVTALIRSARAKLAQMEVEERGPTPQEWEELNAEITRLRGELHG